MKEAEPHYEAGSGIRPPRRGGKVRAVAREVVPGGGMELWHCDHDHAPGVRDMRQVTQAQRDVTEACAATWLAGEIADGRLQPMEVRTETTQEALDAEDAIVISLPGFQEPGRRTRRVVFSVDTPGDVTDVDLSGVFARMWADAPVMPGWWVSPPSIQPAEWGL